MRNVWKESEGPIAEVETYTHAVVSWYLALVLVEVRVA